MRFKGRIVDHVMLANGEQRLTIQTRDDLRGLYDQLHNDEVSTDVKKYRKPRSLDANAYFHLLVNRIAATVGASDDEVKRELVVRYGSVEKDEDGSPCGIVLPATADVDRVYPYTYFYKAMELNGAQSLVLTDGVDSVVNSLDGPNKLLSHNRVDNLLGLCALHSPYHLGISYVELVLNLSGKHVPVGFNILLHVVWHSNNKLSVAWNGIMQLAAVELSQQYSLIAVHLLIQETA